MTAQQAVQIPVAGRSCEGCAMCCKLGSIAEVNKPDGQWCQHCTSRKSCDIYDIRPQVCRDYYCYYMISDLDEEWRPTTSKMMVAQMQNKAAHIFVDASRPDAWRKEPYFTRIVHWSKQTWVVVFVGLRVWAVYPDRIDDLGVLHPGNGLRQEVEETSAGTIRRTVMVRAA